MKPFSLFIYSHLLLSFSVVGFADAQNKKIVFLGDSLTEGYQLDSPDQAFPALICQKLKLKLEKDFGCINSGVSGNTSKGLLSRLDWALKANPEIAVVSIGSNDGLRGIVVKETKKNLQSIVEKLKAKKIRVLITGQKMPPNYGKEFLAQFEAVFSEVAKSEKVPLMPFLLEGVAGRAELNLPDGIHPNKEGHKIIADNLLKFLEPLL
ncbi:MAG: arylesterase [Bdellovibrionales bacterium]|nr:arylesterase [Bdellovibrionales bacterium]